MKGSVNKDKNSEEYRQKLLSTLTEQKDPSTRSTRQTRKKDLICEEKHERISPRHEAYFMITLYNYYIATKTPQWKTMEKIKFMACGQTKV